MPKFERVSQFEYLRYSVYVTVTLFEQLWVVEFGRCLIGEIICSFEYSLSRINSSLVKSMANPPCNVSIRLVVLVV